MNRAGISYKMDVNHFADQSSEEISLIRGTYHTGEYNGAQEFPLHPPHANPSNWDWRIQGESEC